MGTLSHKGILLVGLINKSHEFFLLTTQQDVRRQGGHQLPPNLRVPLGKSLQFGKYSIVDAVAQAFSWDLAETQQHFGDYVVNLVSQLLLELLVQRVILRSKAKSLGVRDAIIVLYEVGRPVGHKDGFKEGICCLGNSGRVAS